MTQKRCLNCGLYIPDDLDLEGNPIPDTIPASFGFSGVCSSTGKRVKDGWSCGKWAAKSDSKWTCESCGAKFNEPKWLEQPEDIENPICPECESLNIDLTESIIKHTKRSKEVKS